MSLVNESEPTSTSYNSYSLCHQLLSFLYNTIRFQNLHGSPRFPIRAFPFPDDHHPGKGWQKKFTFPPPASSIISHLNLTYFTLTRYFSKQDFEPYCPQTLKGFVGLVTKIPNSAEINRTEIFKERILETGQKIHTLFLSNVSSVHSWWTRTRVY